MGDKIKLGHGVKKKYACLLATEPIMTIDQRLDLLEARIETLATTMVMSQLMDKPTTNNHNAYDDVIDPNKDGLPVGLMLVGTTKGVNHVLMVEELGYSVVPIFEGESQMFVSLSAAAEAVSGVRRSGWTFWKLEDGRSVKEAFRKT